MTQKYNFHPDVSQTPDLSYKVIYKAKKPYVTKRVKPKLFAVVLLNLHLFRNISAKSPPFKDSPVTAWIKSG